MLTQRQEELLKLIVENYIKTATPVSSKALCKKMKCSSATVRNEMATLEQSDLIQKLIFHLVEFQVIEDTDIMLIILWYLKSLMVKIC